MKQRDQLLVGMVLGLVTSAAVLVRRSGLDPGQQAIVAALALLSLGSSLVAWAGWVERGTASLRSRALVLNLLASWVCITLWLEFALAELRQLDTPLRWLLALALAWMSAPLASFGLTRLARRLWS